MNFEQKVRMNAINDTLPANYIFNKPYEKLIQLLRERRPSKVFLLVDTDTQEHCLPEFKEKTEQLPIDQVLTVKSGERSKSFDTCVYLWKALAEHDADRHSLLINLGGGMITDLGGFVASTYKRGIDFINIPTTLLAMVDAAIGGKTGVNLDHLKNQIGTVSPAISVLFDLDYLLTLDEKEVNSGFAEVLKHGLIASKDYWENVNNKEQVLEQAEYMIKGSVSIKSSIVDKDPNEENIRKHLNFGHTLGHAIESYSHKMMDQPMLHGEAIAHGMILESYLSHKVSGLGKLSLDNITNVIKKHFKLKGFSKSDQKNIIELLRYDKKNRNGKVLFVLLNEIGQASHDISIRDEEIIGSFSYLKEI